MHSSGSETTFIVHPAKADSSYAPSFTFPGPLLGEAHGAIHEDAAAIDGWLEPEDSLKLYELGRLAPGPFLEIGTYRGRSTTVLATALRDGGRHVDFFSLDIDAEALESARRTLAARGLGAKPKLVHGSVRAFFRALPGFEPRFVFLDGDHSERGLAQDLATLEARVAHGGLLLFHDFRNPRNEDPADEEYGVPQAIAGSWVARDCEFAGTFGCSALFRRVRAPRRRREDADGPLLLELMSLDRLAVRLRVRVLRPAKRLVRQVVARTRSG